MAYKVNIDAGHGSNTAGKRTTPFTKDVDINGDGIVDVKAGEQYREHYANVMVASYLEKELKRCGIEINKTGWDDDNAKNDEDTALSIRQKLIKTANCDLSVSIHFNAAGNANTFSSAEGVSVHIHSSATKVGDSKRLADLVLAQLIQGTTQKNRGVVKQELAMCNCTAMGTKAAILCELAFMTNAREAMELMASEAFAKECASEIAKGICSYLGVNYVTTDALKTTVTNTKTEKQLRVKVISDVLNVRKGPGTSFDSVTTIKRGEVYTIVETNGTWGKLLSGTGWISLGSNYVQNI